MSNLEELTNKINTLLAPYEVFAVGGAVRDTLLGTEPKDYDYAVGAPIEDVERIVKAAGRRVYGTGRKFGTIGFKLQTDDGAWHYVEVTQFRGEKYTPGSRKPEVTFVNDLQHDLSRRDYSINAIAYRDGEYYDPYSGRIEILAKKIRPVGEGSQRIKEDALRTLRAARFAAQLDFEVDPNFIGTMRKYAPKIVEVSRERWVLELDKLLVQQHVTKGLDVLYTTYLLRYMLPEIWALQYVNDSRQALYDLLQETPPVADERWGIFLAFTGRPYTEAKENRRGDVLYPNQHLIARELSVGIAHRLKFSNDRTAAISAYLSRLQS